MRIPSTPDPIDPFKGTLRYIPYLRGIGLSGDRLNSSHGPEPRRRAEDLVESLGFNPRGSWGFPKIKGSFKGFL